MIQVRLILSDSCAESKAEKFNASSARIVQTDDLTDVFKTNNNNDNNSSDYCHYTGGCGDWNVICTNSDCPAYDECHTDNESPPCIDTSCSHTPTVNNFCQDFQQCIDSACVNFHCGDKEQCEDSGACTNTIDCADGTASGCVDSGCANSSVPGVSSHCTDSTNCLDTGACSNLSNCSDTGTETIPCSDESCNNHLRCSDNVNCTDTNCTNSAECTDTGGNCMNTDCTNSVECTDTGGLCVDNSCHNTGCDDETCHVNYCEDSGCNYDSCDMMCGETK